MEVQILDQNGEKVVVIEGRVDTVTAPDLDNTGHYIGVRLRKIGISK